MRIFSTRLLFCTLVFTTAAAKAQLRAPVTNNDLRNNLQKVIDDFPYELNHVKADTLEDNPQTVEFTTQLDFKGAMDNSVTQYKSTRPIYSWKATLLSTEDFDEASQKYHWLSNQLKVMTINLTGGYSFSLSGNYQQPDESRKFSSSIYKLTPGAINLPKLKIEASMQFEFPEWKVYLLVYEKEREDDERGDIYGD
jgi:hypothetical protein